MKQKFIFIILITIYSLLFINIIIASPTGVPSYFKTYNEFYNAINAARKGELKQSDLSNKYGLPLEAVFYFILGLEKTTEFFDFNNINDDIKFDGIEENGSGAIIYYIDDKVERGNHFYYPNNEIRLYSYPSEFPNDYERYLEYHYNSLKNNHDVVERIMINNIPAIKGTITVHDNNKYKYNRYNWVQDGYSILLVIYGEMAEKYDEKDFFDLKLVQVPLEDIKPKTYTVTFKNGTKTIGKPQTIKHGNAAKAPKTPTKKGFIFNGWDKKFNNVTKNLTVNAKWKKITGKLTPAKTSTIRRKRTLKLRAKGNASIKNVKWKVSNKRRATIKSSGKNKTLCTIKSVRKGKVTVTARITFKDGTRRTVNRRIKIK